MAVSPGVADTAEPEQFFLRVRKNDPYFSGHMQRVDWLGNDKMTAANVIGTNSCRSRHSNHMKGKRVAEEFASDTLPAIASRCASMAIHSPQPAVA